MKQRTFTDVPVHEGALGVHQVELVVQTGPGLGDGGGVGQHADGAMHLGQVTARHHGGGLVVDTNLKNMNQNGVVDQQCTTCHLIPKVNDPLPPKQQNRTRKQNLLLAL